MIAGFEKEKRYKGKRGMKTTLDVEPCGGE
jgi:hypothetical protein